MGRRLVIGAVLLAVLAAGCGSSKKTAAPPTTTAAAAPTTTAAASPTTTASSSSSNTPNIAKFATNGNCRHLEEMAANVAKSINPANGKLDPNAYADAIEKMADAAPSDIKSDFKTFADAYASFVKTYTSSGYNPGSGKVPTPAQIAKLTAASKALSTPQVQAAEQHLAAWGRKNCGTG